MMLNDEMLTLPVLAPPFEKVTGLLKPQLKLWTWKGELEMPSTVIR